MFLPVSPRLTIHHILQVVIDCWLLGRSLSDSLSVGWMYWQPLMCHWQWVNQRPEVCTPRFCIEG